MIWVLTVIVEMKDNFTKEAFEFLEMDKLSIVANREDFHGIIITSFMSGDVALVIFYILKKIKLLRQCVWLKIPIPEPTLSNKTILTLPNLHLSCLACFKTKKSTLMTHKRLL